MKPRYLPMLWETVAQGETEPSFDFRYVTRSEEGHYQAYGLARPAVFSRSDLAALFAIYRRIVGREIFPWPDGEPFLLGLRPVTSQSTGVSVSRAGRPDTPKAVTASAT